MSSGSSRRGKQRNVSKESTMVRRRRSDGRWYEVRPDGSERLVLKKSVDWSRLNAGTDAEKLAAARSDPDALPLIEDQLKRMRRSPFAKLVRQRLDLSQEEFASVFGIPIGTLRDW